jgi:hypothetical protein
MRALVLGLALAACVLTTGCSQEVSAGAPQSPVGSWVFDGDGFVDTNWEWILEKAKPAIDRIKEGNARLEAMPEGQRAEAEARVRERLSERDVAIYEATLAGPAAVKEWAKEQLRLQVSEMTLTLEFRADGTCTVSYAAGAQEHQATGTWTQRGHDVTLTMTVVDGRDATAKDREPKTITMRSGRLHMAFGAGAPALVARRA